jgi:hypothetical protein
MEIFKLFGSILVDSEQAEKSIQKTDDKALDLGKTLSNGAKKAGEFGLAVAGGAVAAGTAMLAVANDTAKTADEIDKASIRMGISAESFQELKYAAEQSGVEVSTLEKAAKKLEGTDLNMDEAMEQIMALGTAEERSAKAAELFGDAIAYNMAPMLEMSGEEMDAMKQRANDLGLVMSGDDVKAGVKFGDTMADITKSLKALGTQVGSAIMPIVQKFADMILQFLPKIQGMMDQLIPVIIALADAVLPPLMDLIEQILPVVLDLITQIMPFLSELISAVMPIIVELIQTLLPMLMDIIGPLLPVVVELLQALMPLLELAMSILKPILDLVVSLISPLMDIISNILTPITGLIDGLVKGPLSKLTPVLEGLAKILSGVLGTAFEFIMAKVDLVVSVFSGLLDFISNIFQGNWEGAWQAVVDTFGKVFEGIVNVAKVPINAIIKMLNSAIDGINSIKIPDWVPGVGGKNLNIQKIPLLAKGGEVDESGLAIVGERGPELLNLPQGASVHPLSSQIDYGKLTDAFVQALRMVAPEMATNVRIEGNTDRIVDVLLEENEKSIYSTGRALFA